MHPHPFPSLPEPDAMAQALRLALPHFGRVTWAASTASTNKDLMDWVRAAQTPLPCLQGAHLQTQGRGRAGKPWENQTGDCLMFSCAFDVFLAPPLLPMLSPLSGVGACCALRAYLPAARQAGLDLKWPNDLQWIGAKLAGILVETTRARKPLSAQHHVVVMGIGLNLRNAQALGAALGRDVADWSQVVCDNATATTTTTTTGAANLAARIAQHWQASIARLHTQGPGDFPQGYAGVDALAGKPVNVLHQGTVVLSGVAQGVNTCGQLLVNAHGKDVAVTVGEVSVRTT